MLLSFQSMGCDSKRNSIKFLRILMTRFSANLTELNLGVYFVLVVPIETGKILKITLLILVPIIAFLLSQIRSKGLHQFQELCPRKAKGYRK